MTRQTRDILSGALGGAILCAALAAVGARASDGNTPTPTAPSGDVIPMTPGVQGQLALYQCEADKLGLQAQLQDCRAFTVVQADAARQKVDLTRYRYDQAAHGFRLQTPAVDTRPGDPVPALEPVAP